MKWFFLSFCQLDSGLSQDLLILILAHLFKCLATASLGHENIDILLTWQVIIYVYKSVYYWELCSIISDCAA